jgi:hypothetical protein
MLQSESNSDYYIQIWCLRMLGREEGPCSRGAADVLFDHEVDHMRDSGAPSIRVTMVKRNGSDEKKIKSVLLDEDLGNAGGWL